MVDMKILMVNTKMVDNYLNFIFRIEVKTKARYRILNFVFQFIKNTKWHFGYTDSAAFGRSEAFWEINILGIENSS